MKILQVCDYYQHLGGTEDYLISISKELEKASHKVGIVYAIKSQDTINVQGRAEYFLPFSVNSAALDKNIEEKLREIIIKESPDIIYIHNIPNYYIIEKLLTLRPVVRYVHDHRLFCPSRHKILPKSNLICNYPVSFRCVINAYKNRCLPRNPVNLFSLMKSKFHEIKTNKKINKIIVASKYMKYCLEKNGFDPSKIEIIPYFTQPNTVLSPEKCSDNVILFVGRLHWTKGLQYLLKALSYIKEPFKLLICGEGPYEEKAKKLVEDLDLSEKAEFIGWVDRYNLAKYYLMSSLVVIPSLWPEPFGIVGIEAISYAKPVVAFDVGGISEWLKDGENGFLVNCGDSRALAEKILILLQNKDLALELGEQGKKLWATKFSKEIHLKKLIEIFKQCL